MFDQYARSLLIDVPELEGLTGDNAARALSGAYLALLQLRTNGGQVGEETGETQAFLRRMANALMFEVVLVEQRPPEQRRAAAFVAAESIALLADFIAYSDAQSSDRTAVFLAERFTRVESAVLYLYSQYDACAAGVLTLPAPTVQVTERIDERAAVWCLGKIENLCRLRTTYEGSQDGFTGFAAAARLGSRELEQDTVGRLYVELGKATAEFASWLGGGEAGLQSAQRRIDSLLAALTPAVDSVDFGRIGHDYARIYHLATLLRLCFPELAQRSLCHVVPPSPGSDGSTYRNYLQTRANGTADSIGRPLLWPSAFEYVRTCILGNLRHAVVSMPTGSGKSFVGELAVSQALHAGWVLYLAPTNALAEQTRGDLRIGLEALGTEVLAFIGDQEYSMFAADSVAQMNVNSVAVMTPEKCALALRLSPDAFRNCMLVVFDECHLIGDSGSTRGPTAELVVSQLMIRAPNARFLLMSAIIQNPDDLAGWLAYATGGTSSPISIRWRPTRTLRSVLGVEKSSFQAAATAAKNELSELPDRRKKVSFTAKCSMAACLQGAWQSTDAPDYGVVNLDCDAELSVSRTKSGNKWRYGFNADSWVNATAINLAAKLASQGIQTLVFTPASRHYPFSNAGKTELSEDVVAHCPAKPELIDTLRVLADYELGIVSDVFSLLDSGVAVHTSLMLEVEKIASELAFKKRCIPIMYATGTLAQGLNLPAIAVVIAGTKIGDPRGEDAEVVEQRKFSQLLNAAGRAGRAGFANQGVVITVPDDPIVLDDFQDILTVRDSADFLQQADNAVQVGSGLEQFVDNVCNELLSGESASEVELQVVSLLAGGDTQQLEPEAVLRRTYAAFLRRQSNRPDVTTENVARLVQVRNQFVTEANAPEWLTVAAQRAGLDFFLTLGIFRAWGKIRQAWPDDLSNWGVSEWLDEFLGLVKLIPPGLTDRHLPPERLARVTTGFKALVKNHPEVFFERSLDWTPSAEWTAAWDSVRAPLLAWMKGDSIAEIAALVTEVDEIPSDRTQGKPIPKALSIVGETFSSLSLIAGGFLAVAEQLFEGQVPLPLACLPMCIKYGCNSPGTLGWFRFGVRLRRGSRLLAEVLPPPADLPTDEAIRTWVRATRRDWLRGGYDLAGVCSEDQQLTLAAVRKFITA